MKKTYAIFVVLMSFGMAPAMAGTESCSNEKNNYINPVVALCSTHAYNAASETKVGQNFANENDRQTQREIIARKTTVITQQMKLQYDYLNATVKRLKTQLQKAVLTTSLEAAGASSEKSGSSYSNDHNISLAGAQNCNNQNTSVDVFTCLRNNYNLIYNMSNGGRNPTSELRQQLITDCKTANNSTKGNVAKIDDKCTNRSTVGSAKVFSECLGALNANIRNNVEEIQRQNSQTSVLQSMFGNR